MYLCCYIQLVELIKLSNPIPQSYQKHLQRKVHAIYSYCSHHPSRCDRYLENLVYTTPEIIIKFFRIFFYIILGTSLH